VGARAEGLGIALLEGMATGRPVVALPTGGVPEIVRDGETGWLAYGSGEAALTRVLESVLRERGTLADRGRRARELVRTRYDLRTMRDGYARVYAEVVAG
jgi:glycosyltransferase involved in cell wall biosynthesis